MDNKKISTTALAREMKLPTNIIFERLGKLGLIARENDSWILTRAGVEKGGVYKKHPKYGDFIAWPDSILTRIHQEISTPESYLTATTLGKQFDLSASRLNAILAEIGWITKTSQNWMITESGKKVGGIQSIDKTSGNQYVRWPESITSNTTLVSVIRDVSGEISTTVQDHHQEANTDEVDFRNKFPATHRAVDGHNVRSKAELLIDNWLYMFGIVHAYERKLPIEEPLYCDFYLPAGKVYIEYWGFDSNPKYISRKQKKIEIYRKYNYRFIELTDKEVQNLDDILPQLLMKYGITTD